DAWLTATWAPLTAFILPGVHGASGPNRQPICLARHWSEVEGESIRWPVCIETRWERNTLLEGQRVAQEVTKQSPDQTVSVVISDGPSSATAVPTSDERSDHELDTDSPLDNANFLSFEDWKKQNLAKVGQSAENMRGQRHPSGKDDRRRPTGINNALDSLGEDVEIELDFGGFGAGASEAAKPTSWGSSIPTAEHTGAINEAGVATESPGYGELRKGPSRGKDAGTTCKERFNYASFDCAATVLKTNPECKGSSSVLVENKDSYMLNECRAKNKFLVLELCDDILVDTVVLANYEFFSSIFHTFRVSVADRYPAKPDQWRELGIYEARNTREIQAFAVENPLIWARYLKVEFLTHYGSEFYCPLSLVRVHGTTMLEEYKHDGDSNRIDDEPAEETLEPSLSGDVEGQNTAESAAPVGDVDAPIIEPTPTTHCPNEAAAIARLLQHGPSRPVQTCDKHDAPTEAGGGASNQPVDNRPEAHEDTSTDAASPAPIPRADVPAKGSTSDQKVTGTTGTNTESESSTIVITDTTSHNVTSETETKPASSPKDDQSGPSESIRPTPTATQPASSNPTTQESFFKSVHKRLQMLESNSTLSLLYIEEQSRILRDAFNKVEKRQLAKTSTFLENLNVTVLNELREFRDQYDQVWKSVALEFEHQRIQYHQEIHSINGQLGVLADELVFQKRVSVIQSIMILFCFALVLFSRGTMGTYIDIPRVQNIMTRSYSLRTSSPVFGSPSVSPSSTRHTSSYRRPAGHRRNISEDSEDPLSPTIAYSPPTPPSDRSTSEEVDKGETPALDTLHIPDLAPPQYRSRSSPPILNSAEGQGPESEGSSSSDFETPSSTDAREE
ncbi:UNC-like C-terminal-domain-containing protein, partial [Aspergillus avenaceus]